MRDQKALIGRLAARNRGNGAHEIPKEITRVEGCDCGGGESHRVASPWSSEPGCSIWDLDREQYLANIDAANERSTAYCAELNRLNNLHTR